MTGPVFSRRSSDSDDGQAVGEGYTLTDASGRRFVSSAPTPPTVPSPAPVQPAPVPGGQPHGHPPAAGHTADCCAAPRHGASGRVPRVAGVVLVAGVVAVALLLSVALVALAVVATVLSVTVCAVVLRSMTGINVPFVGGDKHPR